MLPHLTEADLRDQRDWSIATFGPYPRPAGLVKHLRKELVEIEKAPDDLTEYIDVMILAFDGALRCTHGTPARVLHAFEGAAAAMPFVVDLWMSLLTSVDWVPDAPDDVAQWTLVAAVAYEIALDMADLPDVGSAGETVVAEYRNKMVENRRRTWPDWREVGPNEAVEHIR